MIRFRPPRERTSRPIPRTLICGILILSSCSTPASRTTSDDLAIGKGDREACSNLRLANEFAAARTSPLLAGSYIEKATSDTSSLGPSLRPHVDNLAEVARSGQSDRFLGSLREAAGACDRLFGKSKSDSEVLACAFIDPVAMTLKRLVFDKETPTDEDKDQLKGSLDIIRELPLDEFRTPEIRALVGQLQTTSDASEVIRIALDLFQACNDEYF